LERGTFQAEALQAQENARLSSAASDQIASLKTELLDAKREIDRLKRESKKAQERADSLEQTHAEQIRVKTSEINDLQGSLRESENVITHLKQKAAGASSLRTENNNLVAEVHRLATALRNQSSPENEEQKYARAIAKLKRARSVIADLQKRLSDGEVEIAELRAAVDERTVEIRRLRRLIARSEAKRTRSALHEFDVSAAKLRETHEKLTAESAKLRENVETLKLARKAREEDSWAAPRAYSTESVGFERPSRLNPASRASLRTSGSPTPSEDEHRKALSVLGRLWIKAQDPPVL
jgi:chromosome segregation ATPase